MWCKHFDCSFDPSQENCSASNYDEYNILQLSLPFVWSAPLFLLANEIQASLLIKDSQVAGISRILDTIFCLWATIAPGFFFEYNAKDTFSPFTMCLNNCSCRPSLIALNSCSKRSNTTSHYCALRMSLLFKTRKSIVHGHKHPCLS